MFIHSVTIYWGWFSARHCPRGAAPPGPAGEGDVKQLPQSPEHGQVPVPENCCCLLKPPVLELGAKTGDMVLPVWVNRPEKETDKMTDSDTECWEAQEGHQRQLRAGGASGVCPGGGDGTWSSQAEGPGWAVRLPWSFLQLQEVSCMKCTALSSNAGGTTAAQVEMPCTRAGGFKTLAQSTGCKLLSSPCFTECGKY